MIHKSEVSERVCRQALVAPRLASSPDRRPLLGAVVTLCLLTVELTGRARRVLGAGAVSNVQVQVLTYVMSNPGVAPSDVAGALGLHRSAVSRALIALRGGGLVRDGDPVAEGRRVGLEATAAAEARVSVFEESVSALFSERAESLRQSVDAIGPEVTTPDTGGVPDIGAVLSELTRTGLAWFDDVAPVLDSFGLHGATDRAALTLICHRGIIRPGELMVTLRLSSSGTSTMLARLEGLGLVARRQVPSGDHRMVEVSCTARGVEAVDGLVKTFVRHAQPVAASLGLALSLAGRGEASSTGASDLLTSTTGDPAT
jgi:DNA-binding MarR family transcriptional regulator